MEKVNLFLNNEFPCYLFVDTHKGMKRINVVAHGDKYTQTINFKSRYTPPERLKDEIERYYNNIVYSHVRLICCFSAFGGEGSFACKLSMIMKNISIKGYFDIVGSTMGFPKLNQMVMQHGLQAVRVAMENANYILDKKSTLYSSAIFKNGQLIKKGNVAGNSSWIPGT